MARVQLENAYKKFGKTIAIRGLNIDIADGEFVVLLGPTGAGKTTTLRLIAGLEKLDEGSISIGGRDMGTQEPAVRDVSFVFQQYSLYPHLNVRENLEFPLKSPTHNLDASAINNRVEEVAKMVRIHHKLDSRSTQLSGGEMQRVAIGRALVRKPSIFLMDEPLSSLDAKLRGDLRLELKRIQRDLGATILYVTHDQIEAMTLADRVGILSEGELLQIGSPREIYESPNSIHVAQRLGQPSINHLPMGLIPASHAPQGAISMGVRTEHLKFKLAKTGDEAGSAMVERIEHLGDQIRMHVDLQGHKIVTLAEEMTDVAAHSKIVLSVSDPLFFDQQGNTIHV